MSMTPDEAIEMDTVTCKGCNERIEVLSLEGQCSECEANYHESCWYDGETGTCEHCNIRMCNECLAVHEKKCGEDTANDHEIEKRRAKKEEHAG